MYIFSINLTSDVLSLNSFHLWFVPNLSPFCIVKLVTVSIMQSKLFESVTDYSSDEPMFEQIKLESWLEKGIVHEYNDQKNNIDYEWLRINVGYSYFICFNIVNKDPILFNRFWRDILPKINILYSLSRLQWCMALKEMCYLILSFTIYNSEANKFAV